MRLVRLALLLALATGVVAIGAAASPAGAAGGGERITNYAVNIEIEPDGDLLITETIEYDFGVVPKHGIFRDVPVRVDYPKKAHHDRVYPLEVEQVRATEGTPGQYSVETVGNDKQIKIGDPDVTITGEHGYEITYRIEGALNAFRDHDELYWDAIGPDWNVIIEHATVTVEAPADITQVACFSGAVGSTLPCGASSVDGAVASFEQQQMLPRSAFTVVVGLPKGAVSPAPEPILEERWYLARGFEPTALNLAGFGVLAVLLGGWFGVVAYRRGRDRRYAGSHVDAAFGGAEDAEEEIVPLGGEDETPVEFEPPDDLRPGQIGTLVDFTAHPLDVTATIVDLAVRGYLVIEEIDSDSRKPDWKLLKQREPEGLQPYEVELVKALFGRKKTEVKLSGLRYKFAKKMARIQDELMDDAMERQWFTKRPGQVRAGFGVLGGLVLLAGIAAFVLAIIFTRLALWPIPIIGFGLALIVGAYWMPRRTAKGYAVLRRVNGFRRFIDESEKERARFAEKQNLFSEYLPYAIVFGATEKWAKAFAGLDDRPPDTSSWYHSSTPFTVFAFSSAIDGFTVSSAGTLASTPPSTSSGSGSSGFSGGGFSGGGGGGGGGGSW
ncbi:MAG TPA: DUF2207 domain-containing protein [Acidimicrobiia bacterium]